MAAGILAVGLLLIAGTFPAGIFLTAAAVEQTIAPIVADEAFAKIQLYGLDPNGNLKSENPYDYLYPSIGGFSDQVYSWSPIWQHIDPTLVQVIVFVCRKTGSGLIYYQYDLSTDTISTGGVWPTPVRFPVSAANNILTIANVDHQKFITDGCTIVADVGGNNIYNVLDHYKDDVSTDTKVVLNRDWEGGAAGWIVPPPVSGGRSPVVGVYQRIIKF
jgi:hypothetical protein